MIATEESKITLDTEVEGRWIYVEDGAGGYGMHPMNEGKIFLAKQTKKYKVTCGPHRVIEFYTYSNPNAYKSYRGGPVSQCSIDKARFATREEIKNLNR